jgi:hypothetical protein
MNKNIIFIFFIIVILFNGCSKTRKIQVNNRPPDISVIQNENYPFSNIPEHNQLLIDTHEVTPRQALIFSDRVNIRNKPNLDSAVIGQLNTFDEITIFKYSGSNNYKNNVWDRWYKISDLDEKWVNGYYVALYPFQLSISKGSRNDIPVTIEKYEDFSTDSIVWGYWTVTAEEKKELFKDNVEIRLSNFTIQLTNGKLLDHPMQNINEFKYIEDWRPDMVEYLVYEITIDNKNNVDKTLLYDIKINDTLTSLTEKLGITSFPVYSYTYGYGIGISGSVKVKLEGTDKLEKVIWEIPKPYGR